MMGKSQRDKGARWEREVARLLREAGIDARRGLGQARSASEVPDVECPGWWIECKVGGPAQYPMRALLQAAQALEAAGGDLADTTPVAICKADRREPTATWCEYVRDVQVDVTTSLTDWIRMVAAEQGKGGTNE